MRLTFAEIEENLGLYPFLTPPNCEPYVDLNLVNENGAYFSGPRFKENNKSPLIMEFRYKNKDHAFGFASKEVYDIGEEFSQMRDELMESYNVLLCVKDETTCLVRFKPEYQDEIYGLWEKDLLRRQKDVEGTVYYIAVHGDYMRHIAQSKYIGFVVAMNRNEIVGFGGIWPHTASDAPDGQGARIRGLCILDGDIRLGVRICKYLSRQVPDGTKIYASVDYKDSLNMEILEKSGFKRGADIDGQITWMVSTQRPSRFCD